MQRLCSNKSDENMVGRQVFASGCGLREGTNNILAFTWRVRNFTETWSRTVTNPRFTLGTPQLCFSTITAVRMCLVIEVTLQKFNMTQFIKSEFEENSCSLCALNPHSIRTSVVNSLSARMCG